MRTSALLDAMPGLAARLRAAQAVLAGESAAHAYLAAATGSVPGQPVRFSALAPRRIEALGALDVNITGVDTACGEVEDVLRTCLSLFSTVVTLLDGTQIPALSREAVLAELLARGGLAIGLAGTLLRVANDPPVDVDVVREILKAARQGERFQPLLELLDVA